MIRLQFCTMRPMPWGVETVFPDGAISGAWAHDTDHYREVTRACGFEADTLAYVRAHEIAHNMVAEITFGRECYVVWQEAHGLPIDERASFPIERLVWNFQRFLVGLERPFDVAWIPWAPIARQRLATLTGQPASS